MANMNSLTQSLIAIQARNRDLGAVAAAAVVYINDLETSHTNHFKSLQVLKAAVHEFRQKQNPQTPPVYKSHVAGS